MKISANLLAQPVADPPPASAQKTKPDAAEAKKAAAAESKPAVAEKPIVLVPGPATITGDNVNVRGKAAFAGEIIARLKKGDTVKVIEQVIREKPKAGEPSQWAKIGYPTNVHVWVHTGQQELEREAAVQRLLALEEESRRLMAEREQQATASLSLEEQLREQAQLLEDARGQQAELEALLQQERAQLQAVREAPERRLQEAKTQLDRRREEADHLRQELAARNEELRLAEEQRVKGVGETLEASRQALQRAPSLRTAYTVLAVHSWNPRMAWLLIALLLVATALLGLLGPAPAVLFALGGVTLVAFIIYGPSLKQE